MSGLNDSEQFESLMRTPGTAGPARDILTLGAEEAINMPEAERDGLKFYAMKVVGLNSAQDVAKRIFEYITMNSLCYVPIKLGTLNRRFGRIASKHGDKASDIVQRLAERNLVFWFDRDGVTALYNKRVWNEQQALYMKECDWEPDTPNNKPDLGAFRSRVLTHTI
jgi:hypothetical protein